jgi:acetyl-CoA carboxylase carboxyl transferase subunit alpha
MSRLKRPVIATVIGEGGSGGALALGVANRVLMLEFSTYSVITPEGCASILWRDGTRAPDAAAQLKLLAGGREARLGIVDEVVERAHGRRAPGSRRRAAKQLGVALRKHLKDLSRLSPEQLIEDRYGKFRKMGVVKEESAS